MTRTPTRRLLVLALATALTPAPALPALAQTANPFAPPTQDPQQPAATQPAPVAAPAPATVSNETFTVSDIRIDGLQRISAGTVFTYLPIERGDTIDQGRAGEAIRALYKTGFFEDIRLDRQGDILVVTLVERPAINKLTFTGNKDIKTEDLTKNLKDIGLAEGETFDRLALDRVTQELQRAYNNRGKYSVEISPTVARLDRNRVDITVAVKEGKAAKIRHINLVGNEQYGDELITDGWESREHNWMSWYKRDDQYSREKLSGDIEKLNNFYLDRGYVDFSLDSTQVAISPDKRDMFITAGLTEGDVYTISEVKISGDTVLPKEELELIVALVQPGQVFSRRLLEWSSDAIVARLGNIGYAFAQVNPIPNIDTEKDTVGIDFRIVPGPRVNVRRIVFKGNSRTADEVLRREMRQFEGAWYSQAAIDRSKVRLQRLGYFESVEVEVPTVAGTDDQVDLVFDVKETTSGSFMVGVGYSQLSGLNASVQLSENNFLGSGNHVSIAAQRSGYQQRYDFSFTNPYFTDEGMSLGYNLWWRELDYADFNTAQYSTTSAAAQVFMGLPITESDTVSSLFGVDSNEVLTSFGTPQRIVDYIDAVGNRTFHTWRAQAGYSRDTRNQYLMPSAGTYQRISAEVALPGSTVEYYKIEYDFSKYWPLSSWLVLNTTADLGYGDGYGEDHVRHLCVSASADCTPGSTDYQRTITAAGLPFFENFYAGGVSSSGRVRGFVDNTLGPQDFSFGYAQPIGGSLKTVGSLEFIFPTLFDTPAARVSAFLDFGTVFDGIDNFDAGELRASAGVALVWRSPMGPIAISYALPFRKEDFDQTERLQFTFTGGL